MYLSFKHSSFQIEQRLTSLSIVGVGVILCGATAPIQHWDYKPFYEQAIRDGKPMASPEYRLRPLMIGGIFVPIGVFWLAWTARPGVYWASPVIRYARFSLLNVAKLTL